MKKLLRKPQAKLAVASQKIDFQHLSRTNSAVPISLLLLIAFVATGWTFFQGTLPPLTGILFLLAGMLSFTLAEYLVHRFFYHMPTPDKWRENLQMTIHGNHHAHPLDDEHLALPPFLSAPISMMLIWLGYIVAGPGGIVFMSGFICGYAAYLSIHYIMHMYSPPKNFFKILWRHHAIHHYRNNQVAFGVSSPVWDFVFGTMP
ncbi:MAG: fatty acid hydroxylase [Bacteroidetes bacterium]|jgi:4-hydroxysphinganine ceramide fatty acyl 2-hydroxylase|nr:MAG: fatty acid hydroxylase [Bacteroidota bacterium]